MGVNFFINYFVNTKDCCIFAKELKQLKIIIVMENKNKFVTVMFPYPSGSGLHCGHWYNYAIIDSYCRYLRFVGYDVSDFSNNWNVYGNNLKDYQPTEIEKTMLIDRISERITNSKKQYWHFNKKKISKEEAVRLINELR